MREKKKRLKRKRWEERRLKRKERIKERRNHMGRDKCIIKWLIRKGGRTL